MKIIDKDKLENTLKKRIEGDVNSGRVGGASVCVMQDGECVYKNCFGYKDVETREILTSDTVFRMASMTKPITAVCIMILEEQNRISVDDPISKYIPDFAHMNIGETDRDGNIKKLEEAKRPLTIRRLLSHKSGFESGDIGYKQREKMTAEDKKTLKTAVEFYKNLLLEFEPETDTRYSPVGAFDVLARIVELVSGKDISDFAEENIFAPLGMNNTTFAPTEEMWGKMAVMHDYKDETAINSDMPRCVFADFPPTYHCGGAGVVSCLDDYTKFAQMLLNEGEYNGVKILSAESIKKMTEPNPPAECKKYSELWGLGVRVNRNGFYKRLPEGAFGWSGAYGTHFIVDTENKITAVYLKNSLFDGGSGAITSAHFEEDVYSATE